MFLPSRKLSITHCAVGLRRALGRQVLDGTAEAVGEIRARALSCGLVGSKISDLLPVNVLRLIDRAHKLFPKLRRLYDNLSETAHPNFDGTGGAFSKFDMAIGRYVRFGRGISNVDHRRLIIPSLTVPLLLTQRANHGITELMPVFIERCEEALSRKTDPSA